MRCVVTRSSLGRGIIEDMAPLVRAFWGPRPQSEADGVAHIVQLMTGLSEIDGDAFGRWFRLGRSRGEAIKREVLRSEASIARALGRNRRDSDHSVIEELGYSFSAWNGGSDKDGLSLNVLFACTSERVQNSVVMGLPVAYEGNLSRGAAVLDLVSRLWQPEDAHVWGSDREVLLQA
jgi:hypothetical protein